MRTTNKKNMAKAISVENSSGQLVCSICKNVFEEMTLSSCFHTFCPQCLTGHLKYANRTGKPYNCPICRTHLNLPADLLNRMGLPAQLERDKKDNGSSFSDSRAMKIEFCDICDDNKPAINRCLQCQENFCFSCTNAHLKMKASRYHGQRVISLSGQGNSSNNRNYSLGGRDDVSGDQMMCPRHVNEEIIFVCRKCDILLCNVCKLLEHESHVTRLVSEEAVEVREKISTLLDQQTGFSESLQLHLQLLSEQGQQYPHALQHELIKVRNHASSMHAEIEKGKMALERELVRHYSAHIEKTDDRCQDAKQDYHEYVKLTREAQSLVDGGNDFQIVRNGRQLYDQLYNMEIRNAHRLQKHDKPSMRYYEGHMKSVELQTMVGHVSGQRKAGYVEMVSQGQRQTSSYQLPKINKPIARRSSRQSDSKRSSFSKSGSQREVTPSEKSFSQGRSPKTQGKQLSMSPVAEATVPFNDGIGYVYGIAPIGDGKAWVTLLGHQQVVLINVGGYSISSVDIGEIAEDVAHDGSGGCFVTCPSTRSIKYITNKGEVTTIANDFTKAPHGIAAVKFFNSKLNQLVEELYICFTDNNDFSTVYTGSQKGCVSVLSYSGDELGRTLSMQTPVRLDVSTATGLLCISDYKNGCVTITDTSGMVVKSIYTAEEEKEPFKPLGVCFDDAECVLVADWSTGKVRRISQDGSLVEILSINTEAPQSVAMDSDGILWVGGKNGKVNTYKLV